MKFSNPTQLVLVPNASCCWNDCRTACAAGQKKNTPMTTACGASSAHGSHGERKTTRFSAATRSAQASACVGSALVGGLELLELFVAACDGLVEGGLGA